MGNAEIDVVVEDAAGIVGALEKFAGVGTDDRVDGEETAEHDDIVGSEVWEAVVDVGGGVILVELVVGVIAIVEEGERYVSLSIWADGDVVRDNAIGLHEIDDESAYVVVACLGNHDGVEPTTAKANEAIEGRTSRDCVLGLIVAEDDIIDCFANAVYLHSLLHFEIRG